MTTSSPSEPKIYSWTQPICEACWPGYAIGSRGHVFEPTRFRPEVREKHECVMCGTETLDGIFIRIDPKQAPNPTIEK